MQRVTQAHQVSDATYGMPRIHAELSEQGVVAGRNRIARLMRLHGLRGVSRRRGWCVTTKRDKDSQPAPDLVQRRFEASGINQLWVADMTYIPTWAGFGYLAVVLDRCFVNALPQSCRLGLRAAPDGQSGGRSLEHGAVHT